MMQPPGDEVPVGIQPGPDARVVGRPRVTVVLGWGLTILLGLLLLAAPDVGAMVFGGLITLVGLTGMVITLRYRVWIDAPYVIARSRWKQFSAVRLDSLISADIFDGFGPGGTRDVQLLDSTGASLQLQPLLVRLVRLYSELSTHIDPDGPFVNDEMRRMLHRYRR